MTDENTKVDLSMEKLEQIRKTVMEFKDSVASRTKDLHTEIKDWRF
jgi:hypothetical protein